MKLLYKDDKTKELCTNLKVAKKYFGGKGKYAEKLFSIINALQQAETIEDIIAFPPYHFHPLNDIGKKKLKGMFAIDIINRKQPWRLILQPLDENYCVYDPCNIDQIARFVKVVEVMEVSKHYE